MKLGLVLSGLTRLLSVASILNAPMEAPGFQNGLLDDQFTKVNRNLFVGRIDSGEKVVTISTC